MSINNYILCKNSYFTPIILPLTPYFYKFRLLFIKCHLMLEKRLKLCKKYYFNIDVYKSSTFFFLFMKGWLRCVINI